LPVYFDVHVTCAGTITLAELEKALGKVDGSETVEIRAILQKVDKDNSGAIDYEEFVEMMQPMTDEPVRRRKPVIKF
jgi:Ca2+-binding EF-hand superfamily protein